jgi:hypothetical protein
MSDEALKNAESRRDELAKLINDAQQQIEQWRKELGRIEGWIKEWHQFAGSGQYDTVHADVVATISAQKIPNTKKEVVAEFARKIIEERGEPVSRSDLYRVLTKAHGFRIAGSDPEMVLSTMLWRTRDAFNIVRLSKGGGYWLKERPWKAVGYDPDDDDIPQIADNRDPVEAGRQKAEADIFDNLEKIGATK